MLDTLRFFLCGDLYEHGLLFLITLIATGALWSDTASLSAPGRARKWLFISCIRAACMTLPSQVWTERDTMRGSLSLDRWFRILGGETIEICE